MWVTIVGAHLRGAPACIEVLPRMSQMTQIIFFEHELFELHELNHSHTDADLFFEHGKPIERIKMGGRASALDSTNRITETVVGAYLRDAPVKQECLPRIPD